ncbi:hypothetical protein DMUE_4956 [Dictyocoela muelleri]|nr:hypothetical protein DMUE_4956 [Dictyocoela muelleri]
MFIYFLLSNCLEYKIEANSTLELLDEKKNGEIMKFDYFERDDIPITVKIIDDLGRTVYDTTNTYGVVYTRAFNDKKYKIIVQNIANKPVNIVFRVPDVNSEVKNAFGTVEGEDSVKEFSSVLQKIITTTRKYLEHQAENISRIENNGKRLVYFFIFEICFCVGLGIYYQRDLVSVFEKRTKI